MTTARAIRAVTFDCWGTLITDSGFDAAMRRRTEAIAHACDISLSDASELLDRGWKEHHNAWLNTVQYGSEGIASFCMRELAIESAEACATLQEALEEAARLGSQRALGGAVDSLRALREAGIRTALVCDAGFTPGRIVREFLDEHGLGEHLEYCAFSNEVGVPKPDPRIFLDALDALDVEPAEAVHVGDLLRTDIHGGRQLGMKTVRITQISDDATRGFSWTPDAAYEDIGRNTRREPASSPYGEADAVIGHHSELLSALRDLGVILPG